MASVWCAIRRTGVWIPMEMPGGCGSLLVIPDLEGGHGIPRASELASHELASGNRSEEQWGLILFIASGLHVFAHIQAQPTHKM